MADERQRLFFQGCHDMARDLCPVHAGVMNLVGAFEQHHAGRKRLEIFVHRPLLTDDHDEAQLGEFGRECELSVEFARAIFDGKINDGLGSHVAENFRRKASGKRRLL